MRPVIVIAAVATCLLSGCFTTWVVGFSPESFDTTKVPLIKECQTTRAELESLLGPPWQDVRYHGRTALMWTYTGGDGDAPDHQVLWVYLGDDGSIVRVQHLRQAVKNQNQPMLKDLPPRCGAPSPGGQV